ncbi:MAG: rhodanese-like domain-containing protein [Bryobacteraceae bacterium]
MKQVNSCGPVVFPSVPGDQPLDPAQFRNQLEQTDAVVIDLRRPEALGGAHIPRSFNVGAGPNLSMWAAWLVPYDRPILLVGDAETDMDESRRALFRVGFDQVRGFLRGGMAAWIEGGFEQAHVPQISVRELDGRLRSRPHVEVVDVRSPKEWTEGHMETAHHIPGGELPTRYNEIPRESDVHLVCGSGYRSSLRAAC